MVCLVRLLRLPHAQDYKAPDYVDPKLLNPTYAFKQVEEKPSEVNLFNQKHTQKRHRNVRLLCRGHA